MDEDSKPMAAPDPTINEPTQWEKLAKELIDVIKTEWRQKHSVDNDTVAELPSNRDIYAEFRERFFQATSQVSDGLSDSLVEAASILNRSPIRKRTSATPAVMFEKRVREEDGRTKVPLISRFHTGARDIEADIVKREFHELVRTSFSDRLLEDSIPKSDEIHKLRTLADEYCTSFDDKGRPLLWYNEYVQLVGDAAMPARIKQWLDASLFVRLLHGEEYGRVLIANLIEYVARKAWVWQTRITLCIYDSVGMGYLREEDLESYANDFISSADLGLKREMRKGFEAYYTCYITRQIMFLLDGAGTGSISIRDLFSSGLINHLLALSLVSNYTPFVSIEEEKSMKKVQATTGDDDSASLLLQYSSPPDSKNWFAFEKVDHVYNVFIDLDQDADGLLSPAEFAGFDDGKFTQTFVDRIYEVSNTYRGCLDFRAFLDVYFAMRDRNNPASVRFMFRILDLKHTGKVNLACFHHFYRGLAKKLADYVSIANDWDFNKIMTSISAMLNMRDWYQELTVKDFLSSHFGGTAMAILTDVDAFFNYENRYEPDNSSSVP